MVFGQEHVPKTKLASALLEVVNDGRVRVEALGDSLAQLLVVDRVGRDTFFFDELLDLRCVSPELYQGS